jgi:hypothetical protein
MYDYSARQTLSVRVEMIRQVRRRRTAVAFAIVIALPVIVMLAVKFGPSSGGGGLADGDFDVFGLMASGPWNFALSGLLFSEELFGMPLTFTHKNVFTLVSWAIFAALLVGRFLFGWRGRIALRWTLWGFGVLLLAYVGTKFVVEVLLGR